ncbi:homogentisate 1,2-dioxygenase [Aetokthonos hydrillicola Thurmond2011]|jgi:homogentisate 1,2-dioxygenase|uniref:Homogentisate 1,2-dioxygenase n=1 Tax=Aetokthonos hydrillicola Thurmond2011 TaxID=2712845 RepID=A0AAP5MDH2_9CYAN|nr:homogentisate 1,2-dioxygenase [Aetokthonos hydrillicola]MBO3458005.1 homogentisate 1,2-dioxygenase [Aetokthonos hydrillicola CCALA 1050]MBW4587161.1 homogentisate 1,2-dioxygenase [Aetokthonos hydrillicola CCALA 1050]MDR9899329.1 homogentisate 1,2-dioxygenase [Aetokthonos hydrillicola Thurmond2011]
MTYYYKLGNIPHKRHTQFHQPNGSLYHEELIGIRGFTGIQSLLYHLHPPTQVQKIFLTATVDISYEELGPLCHRHLRTATAVSGGDAVQGRIPLVVNSDVCISVAQPSSPMSYWYRLAQGDEVIFIHQGSGVLESQYGILRYRQGDYLVIPAGVLWRILPDTNIEQRMLVIEATGHIEPPARYLNRYGQFLEHAPYSERDIRPPDELVTHDETGEFEVRVKARDRITSYLYHYHPLDVVGWDGHLYPFAFNIEDFEPITGRIHQPPPAHQTFEAPGFVVCSFVPRLFDYHPLAIPAPYNHSNIDSDEVIYYAAGNFMSRRGIEQASITIHPCGIPHGPHPGMYEGSIGKERTDELAVMIDTFHPLRLTKQALQFEDKDYAYSWIA